jgi:hypothetical protein
MNSEKTEFKKRFEQAKTEILKDIEIGVLPNNINSFYNLHKYVDANWYGGFCAEDYQPSENFEFENKVQSAIDKWLKTREQKQKN